MQHSTTSTKHRSRIWSARHHFLGQEYVYHCPASQQKVPWSIATTHALPPEIDRLESRLTQSNNEVVDPSDDVELIT